ncbi:MAG: hypothetical protein HYU48_01120 [Candidatus Levybacteria bacterium]|nr:hypothetical protein [Candidatus Levybacteria bacterium]
MANISQALALSLNNALVGITVFIPRFIAGLVVLLIGILIASILKQAVLELLKALRVEAFLRKYGVPEAREGFSWSNILAEIVRWFVIIVFLIPTVDVWGLSRVVTVLNEFLLYLPNVLVAAIIALVGFVFARLTSDVVLASAKNVTPETAKAVASIVRIAIQVFVILAVLSQLGVATDLIRILFTGLVAMMALGGGIAFGLGGQGLAKDVLDALRRRVR